MPFEIKFNRFANLSTDTISANLLDLISQIIGNIDG